MTAEKPVKLVTSDERDSAEVIEMLEDALKYVREFGVPARCVVIGIVFDRSPRSLFRVRFMGSGVDLLALGTRIPHEINLDVDARQER